MRHMAIHTEEITEQKADFALQLFVSEIFRERYLKRSFFFVLHMALLRARYHVLLSSYWLSVATC